MIFYTFRLVLSRPNVSVFECTKWSDTEREPIDLYTLRVGPRSINCNCYAHGPCKHMELVREIISNSMEDEMHHYMWDHEREWTYINDMVEGV